MRKVISYRSDFDIHFLLMKFIDDNKYDNRVNRADERTHH